MHPSHCIFLFLDGTAFFANSGIKNPFLTQVATNIVNVFMTLPGMWGVERFGRRSLLIWGAVVMCICEYLVAIIGVTISIDNTSGQKALVALVCIYIAAFAATWGPIAWVITGEIFPLNVRAKAMSLAVASNWLWNFGIGYATPYLVNVGPGSAGLQSKVFFIWGSTCACCIVFSFFCIPEVCSRFPLTFPTKSDKYIFFRPKVSHWSRSICCTRTPLQSPLSGIVKKCSQTTCTQRTTVRRRSTSTRRTSQKKSKRAPGSMALYLAHLSHGLQSFCGHVEEDDVVMKVL